ncbi:YIP1 family protein [Candidatus Gottesmanbacteria bacterium]|nr:YIP1 family protein [Candidatus Gottesmanbacteria bacterium]
MNLIQAHFMMMKQIIMSPKSFFDGLSTNEGYKKVLVFTIINVVVALIVSFIFSALFAGNKATGGLGMIILGSVIMIPFILVGFFIWTAILHVVVKILGGKGTYNGSFLAVGYSTALMPFTVIPFIGMVIALYYLYIEIVGFRKIHQFSTVKAAITVILPAALIFVMLFALIAVIGIAFLSAIGQGGLNNPNQLQNMQQYKQTVPQDVQEQMQQIQDSSGTYNYNDTTYPTGYNTYDDSMMQDATQ